MLRKMFLQPCIQVEEPPLQPSGDDRFGYEGDDVSSGEGVVESWVPDYERQDGEEEEGETAAGPAAREGGDPRVADAHVIACLSAGLVEERCVGGADTLAMTVFVKRRWVMLRTNSSHPQSEYV